MASPYARKRPSKQKLIIVSNVEFIHLFLKNDILKVVHLTSCLHHTLEPLFLKTEMKSLLNQSCFQSAIG